MSKSGHIIPPNLYAKTHVPGGVMFKCTGPVLAPKRLTYLVVITMQTGPGFLSSTWCRAACWTKLDYAALELSFPKLDFSRRNWDDF
jgi:hypothetical protein